MHGGILMALRRYTVSAKPWQRALICLALVIAGVALAVRGLHVGVVLMVVGLLVGWQSVGANRRSRNVDSDGETTPTE